MKLFCYVFNPIASAILHLGVKFNIGLLIQYRLLLSLRATAQIALFIACLYIFIELHNLHPKADTVTYIFLFCFSACMGMIMAMQCRAILAADKELLKELHLAEIDGKEVMDYLQKRQMQVFAWLIVAVCFSGALLLAAGNLKIMFLLLGLPAVIDTAIVIILISWELLLWKNIQPISNIE